MFQKIIVNSQLADSVEREISSVKPKWQYTSRTTNYPEITSNEQHKKDIEALKQKFNVEDTQKFSECIFNSTKNPQLHRSKSGMPASFIQMRADPNSRYNREFPNTAKLLDHLQSTYIPRNYIVKRFLKNLQTIRPTWALNEIHPDFSNSELITILYYINDSDGDTYFFEGQELAHVVPPVKGTAAMFRSNMLHAGSPPTKHETRLVINFCFGPKEQS